jgi:hypothetical protein
MARTPDPLPFCRRSGACQRTGFSRTQGITLTAAVSGIVCDEPLPLVRALATSVFFTTLADVHPAAAGLLTAYTIGNEMSNEERSLR